ncbi:DoxX family protein [Streptomyces sp. NPDC002536]
MTAGLATGLFVLRLVCGLLLVAHGLHKVVPFAGGGGLQAGVAEFAHARMRAPLLCLLAASAVQLGSGVLLLLGLLTPLAAAGQTGVMLVAVGVKRGQGFWSQGGGYEYPLVLAALGAVPALTGPGRLALDPVVGWNGGTAYGPLFLGVGVVAGCAALPLLRGGSSAPAGG